MVFTMKKISNFMIFTIKIISNFVYFEKFFSIFFIVTVFSLLKRTASKTIIFYNRKTRILRQRFKRYHCESDMKLFK